MSITSWLGRRSVAAPLLLLLVSACGSGEIPRAQAQTTDRGQREVRPLGDQAAALDTVAAAQLSGAFRAAADRAVGAVVRVDVEREIVAQQGQQDQQFPFFFPFPEGGGQPGPMPATGSGFVFDERGHILTNNHVVENASRVTVTLLDGREYDAEVVGGDPNTDVAVVRIDPGESETLPTAQLGDSEALRVGDWVLALGYPLGLDFTVTAGIVSAKGRSINIIQQQNRLEAFIQTDAAINPGNSGGPLVNLLGQVVGINTAIQSETGRNAGYGFAIPITVAHRVGTDIVEHGVFRRPRLGVAVTTVTSADAEYLGLPEVSGAVVGTVDPVLPAAHAGIRMGDVIVGVDGRRVERGSDVQTLLATREPGDRVNVTLIRAGETLEVPVELAMFESVAAREPEPQAERTAESLLGFQVEPIRAQQASQLSLGERQGVLISSVSGWLQRTQSIQRGQVLLRLNGEEVGSPEDVERIVGGLDPGDVVSLILFMPGVGEQMVEQMVNFRTRR